MNPIHTPYDPEQVTGEFGWLWLDDAPMGPGWHLVQTYVETDDELTTWFAGDGDVPATRCAPAHSYRGRPYLSATAPTCTPGEVDRLEVTVRLADGASVGHAFGNPEQAGRIEAALSWLLSPGDARPRAAGDVLAERRRQVEAKGFTAEHDDAHVRGELGAAAACYAVPSRDRQAAFNYLWPETWDEKWWKPTGGASDLTARRRDLVKAGALILAEIERIDRLAKRRGAE